MTLKRSQVPFERTWDLKLIFLSEELWYEEHQLLKFDINNLKQYQGKISESAATLYNVLQLRDAILKRLEILISYANMRFDVDSSLETNRSLYSMARELKLFSKETLSFISSEINEIDNKVLETYIEEKEELKLYSKYFSDLSFLKSYFLKPKEEAIISEMTELMSSSVNTYRILNTTDLVFPSVIDEVGNLSTLTHARLMNLLEVNDRELRKNAFETFYDTYDKLKNTFSSTLIGTVKAHNFGAKMHSYQSAKEAALLQNFIPETVYDNLIEVVNEKLPLLDRYLKLRKKILKLDELHMYDLYTPLINGRDKTIDYEEAKRVILQALQPLGEECLTILTTAFNNRWIDVEESRGKRSGGYSTDVYGINPFILLNWQNSLTSTYILSHELGHALHTYFTNANQPFIYGNYSPFLAEIASTCNEVLLTEHFLRVSEKKEQIYFLGNYLDKFHGSVFRRCVFAEFEHAIHLKDQRNEPLTAEILTQIYYDINQKYYGTTMFVDKRIGLEWTRSQLFYLNYYVFQYASGYVAASIFSDRLLNEGAVEEYKSFLKAGSSDYPMEILKKANVDMTTKEPIYKAFDVFEERLSEMEKLFK